jgi:hypothetical protein
MVGLLLVGVGGGQLDAVAEEEGAQGTGDRDEPDDQQGTSIAVAKRGRQRRAVRELGLLIVRT